MNQVKQRRVDDCGVAAIAMYLYLPYNQVEFDQSGWGLSTEEIRTVISKNSKQKPVHIDKVLIGVDCIMLVPSLNENGLHYVCWDSNKRKIYDPNKGRKGKKYYKGFHGDIPNVRAVIVDAREKAVKNYMKKTIKKFQKALK